MAMRPTKSSIKRKFKEWFPNKRQELIDVLRDGGKPIEKKEKAFNRLKNVMNTHLRVNKLRRRSGSPLRKDEEALQGMDALFWQGPPTTPLPEDDAGIEDHPACPQKEDGEDLSPVELTGDIAFDVCSEVSDKVDNPDSVLVSADSEVVSELVLDKVVISSAESCRYLPPCSPPPPDMAPCSPPPPQDTCPKVPSPPPSPRPQDTCPKVPSPSPSKVPSPASPPQQKGSLSPVKATDDIPTITEKIRSRSVDDISEKEPDGCGQFLIDRIVSGNLTPSLDKKKRIFL